MPEPVALAITVACASLISSVVTLSKQITTFVSDVRAARKDMDAVSRELSSLTLSLEGLRSDSSKINFPDSLQQNLVGVLRNCDDVTKEMQDLLHKLSSASLRRRMQWSMLDRDEMNKLRSRLEAHKSAIDIALDMISIFLIASVKEDTQAIKSDTAHIKQDTSQIAGLAQEMGLLRLQISQLEDRGGSGGVILERFLAESTTYADSVIDTEDFDDFDARGFQRDPTSTILEEGDASDVESTHTGDDLDRPHRPPELQLSQDTGHNAPFPIQKMSPVPAEQIPAPNRDAHLQSSSNALPARLPVAPSDVNAVSDRARKKPQEQQSHSELDHEAINAARIARRNLSSWSQRNGLDQKLLLLLEGNQDSLVAFPGHNKPRVDKVGTLSEVKAILDCGATPNAKIRLHQSVLYGDCTALVIEGLNACRIDVIRLLLNRGADINARGLFYGTALQAAHMNRHATASDKAATIKLLTEYKAKIRR